MANESAKKQASRPQSAQAGQKRTQGSRRRRRPGVPVVLVIILLILALLMGGLGGFAIARRTDRTAAALQRAEARNIELENILTAIGYNVDQDSPDTWIGGEGDDGLSAITSVAEDGEELDLWDDQSLLQGLLSEDQEPVVVAEFDGGQLMSDEFIPAYNDALSEAIFDGADADEISGSLLQSVLEELVGEKLKQAEAHAQGLDTLTDEDNAAIEAEANAEYEENIANASEMVADEGMSDEDIRAAAIDYLKDNDGITLDSLREDQRLARLEEKYRAYVVKDVTVTDEEVQAHYDELLEEQKGDFDELPDNFFYAHLYGSVVVYNPEGFRAVRDILIPFERSVDSDTAEELMAQLEVLDFETQGDTYNALSDELNALFAPLEATAQEAVDKLQGGAQFESLMGEYGCSEDLKTEPVRSQGLYISSDSQLNSEEFIQGAMMLEQPGEVSVPLRSPLGVHLVQYIGDVTPGPVPLADVKDAVTEDLLDSRQDDYYAEYIDGLLEKANVTYYPDRLQ